MHGAHLYTYVSYMCIHVTVSLRMHEEDSVSYESNAALLVKQYMKNEPSPGVIKAPFTLKRFHSYTERLLWIAFRIRTVYIDTSLQEYEDVKGVKNAKTLEVRPKTTEKVFLLSVSDILVHLEDSQSRKEPFSPVYTHTIRYHFRTAPLRSPFLKTSVYQIVFIVCM